MPAVKKQERKFIRPKMVDVGRGPEPANLDFLRKRGEWLRVPPEGCHVIWEGRERRFFLRRIAEGAAEIVEPTTKAARAKPSADEPAPTQPKRKSKTEEQ